MNDAARIIITLINGGVHSEVLPIHNAMDLVDGFKDPEIAVLSLTLEAGSAVHLARHHIVKIVVMPLEED